MDKYDGNPHQVSGESRTGNLGQLLGDTRLDRVRFRALCSRSIHGARAAVMLSGQFVLILLRVEIADPFFIETQYKIFEQIRKNRDRPRVIFFILKPHEFFLSGL